MTSPLSGATLTAQRAQGRWKRYFLAISHPNSVFTARINQTFDSLDGVNQLTYDGASGDFESVKAGMTCWVGSAPGLFDIGIVRVRKALTEVTAPIGKNSGVAFENNQYLTFVDDFQIWGCDPFVTDKDIWMDDTIVFGAIKAFAPVVKTGPAAIILERTGSTVTHHPTASIYSPNDATIASYLWTAPGASAKTGMSTATPAITYNTNGEFYESCRITDSNGAKTTVYRKVLVNPASAVFELKAISGDIDSGCWSAEITGYSGVDLTSLHDRALCVLWKKDYLGVVRDTSYGLYPGAENARLVGWIDGESLSFDPYTGTASFTIQGPAFWLDKITGAAMTILDESTPATWNEMNELTVDKALYRLIHWQSTLDLVTDISFSGDTTRIKQATVNSDSLLRQINGLAGEKLLASLQFDRFGCGTVYAAQSILGATKKSNLTVLWSISRSDVEGAVDVERVPTENVSIIEIGGASWNGSKETLLYSRAPGNSADHYGDMDAPYSDLALTNQTMCNRLAGDILADANSEYPTLELRLYWPNDFIDIAPGYIVRLSLDASQNPRGISFTNKRFVPQAVEFDYDPRTGAESTVITMTEETTGVPGVTYYPPSEGNPNPYDPPDESPLPFPPSNWFPPLIIDPPLTDGCGYMAEENSFELIWELSAIAGSDTVLSTFAYFPCKLRPASAYYGNSYLRLPIRYQGDARTKVHCYGVNDAKERILTGTVTPVAEDDNWSLTRIDFLTGPSDVETDVTGFELVLDAGGETSRFEMGESYESGSYGLSSPPYTGNFLLLPAGWYSIQGRLGPWYSTAPSSGANYMFSLNGSGKVGYDVDTDTFHNDTPSMATSSERIGLSNYGRAYFHSDGSTPFYVSASTYGLPGGAGTMAWAINYVSPIPRTIVMGYMSRVFNVCTEG